VLRPSGDNAIPVLIQLDRHDLALCDACIQMIRQTASKQQLLLTIGIGTIQDDPLQVYQSWQQAVRALSYRFIAGKGTTIRYDEMEQNAHQLPWYPHQEMELLIRGISGGQEEEIRRAIDSVLEQIKQRRLGLFAARCLGYDLINTVMRVVISQNVKLDVLEAQLTDMISLPQTETIRQLGDFLVDFAIRLSEHLGQSRDTRFDRILVYLDSHFRDSDFSVTNMAADLNMSYSYLNRIFSSRSGQPVLDYLTEKRIEWIKQQLRTTEQPIKTVILSAGYNDIPNFSRKFKQREGISPRQYREQHGRPADSQN
jgi:AraC-like DNA-binding protein